MLHALMFVAIGVGIYVRMKGIGKWPLAVDEYYIAKSVKNILKYGLPKFEGGGYYVRGLLYQYVAAPFLYFGSKDEFYLRIIPAVLNLLAIPPIYCLGKRLSGKTAACIAVIFFSLSLWEIEFSRFARMYAPFQTLFLWYLLCLYKVVIDNDDKYEKWLYLLSFVALFVHESGIFLLFLNFFPLLLKEKLSGKSSIIIKLTLVVIGVLYLTFDFRHLGVDNPIELSIGITHNKNLIPPIFLSTFTRKNIWWLLFFIPMSATVLGAYKVLKIQELNKITKVCITGAFLLPLLNIFTLAMGIFSILLLLTNIDLNKTRALVKTFITVVLINLGFWLAFGLISDNWQALVNTNGDAGLRAFVITLFKFPHFYRNIIGPCLKSIPITTIATIALIAFVSVDRLRKHLKEGFRLRFLLAIIITLGLFIGSVRTPDRTTRYLFFIYPVVLILVAYSIMHLRELVRLNAGWRCVLLLIGILSLLYFCEDFGIYHMRNIDSAKINFRAVYNYNMARHYYLRADYRTPAEIVNKQIKAGDIVMSTLITPDYYLRSLDYFYVDGERHTRRLCRVSGRSGKRDLWSNANLVYRDEDLWKIVRSHYGRTWIISSTEQARTTGDAVIAREISQKYGKFLVGTSLDKMIAVYMVENSVI